MPVGPDLSQDKSRFLDLAGWSRLSIGNLLLPPNNNVARSILGVAALVDSRPHVLCWGGVAVTFQDADQKAVGNLQARSTLLISTRKKKKKKERHAEHGI